MARRRHRTPADQIARRLGLRSPLGRWGFLACTLGALTAGMPGTFAICLVITIYAWKKR